MQKGKKPVRSQLSPQVARQALREIKVLGAAGSDKLTPPRTLKSAHNATPTPRASPSTTVTTTAESEYGEPYNYKEPLLDNEDDDEEMNDKENETPERSAPEVCQEEVFAQELNGSGSRIHRNSAMSSW